jgi:hypothetical protein
MAEQAFHYLRPALRVGREIFVGEKGQSHSQIHHKPGTTQAGFVDLRDGRFLTRSEAAEKLNIPGLSSLDSQTLNRLQR